MFIGGEWKESLTKETFSTKDPANQEVIAEVPLGRSEDVDLAVNAARQAFESESWQTLTPYDRGRLLHLTAQLVREDRDELTKLESLDTGKPISQAQADVEATARYFEFYAGVADKIMGETIPINSEVLDYTVREPLGVTAHIVPWNYPLQIMSRGTAAAIAAGNTVVIKPAEDTPLTALRLASIIEKVGFPKGVFNVVTGFGEAGAALSNHHDIDQITFTGSVETGSAVMMAAAKNIKPVTLELGGKSPNIVFADCDLDEAIDAVLTSIIQNAGQSCSAGSRLLLESSIYDEFIFKLKERMQTIVIGPGKNDPDLGPIISERQFTRIEEFMRIARETEVNIVTGGERVELEESPNGYFFKPTILDRVAPESPLAQEEIFGPVVVAFSFNSEMEAINLANSTPYGLVAGIWTNHIKRAHRVAKKIRAGQIFINNYGVGGGVAMPFGGYKKSGFGREKGLEALQNYMQLKNIAVKL
jgi:aldehyde dehydrogenase (NAD+)